MALWVSHCWFERSCHLQMSLWAAPPTTWKLSCARQIGGITHSPRVSEPFVKRLRFIDFHLWIFVFAVEVLFLAWGVRLCIVVRKAPSEFNESRFISMAIYNEFLLTCFLNVSMWVPRSLFFCLHFFSALSSTTEALVGGRHYDSRLSPLLHYLHSTAKFEIFIEMSVIKLLCYGWDEKKIDRSHEIVGLEKE